MQRCRRGDRRRGSEASPSHPRRYLRTPRNMLFLWVFGDNVEDAMGSLRFLAFYLLCGIAASLTYALMAPGSQAPLIGASGAVSGVVVAYLMLYPRVNVLGLIFAWLPLRIRAG